MLVRPALPDRYLVIFLSSRTNAFEFVRVAALRAAQLMQGCPARVPEGHTCIVTAQMEVASGKVQATSVIGEAAATQPAG